MTTQSPKNLFLRLLMLILAGCLGIWLLSGYLDSPPPDEGIGAGITGINHTDKWVAEFYVEGYYGGNISPIQEGGGGGKTSCCVILPRIYQPGMTAKVRWKPTEEPYRETDAMIMPYPEEGGRAFVHFLPDGRVIIVISNNFPFTPSYQGNFRAPSHPEYRGVDIEFPKLEVKP